MPNETVKNKVVGKNPDREKNVLILAQDEAPWREFELHKIQGLGQLDEIVLFHRNSKMLLVCDSFVNITNEFARPNLFGFSAFIWYSMLMGHYDNFSVLYWIRSQIRDQALVQQSVAKIGTDYDFNGVFMAHGTPISPYGEIDLRQKFLSEWNKFW